MSETEATTLLLVRHGATDANLRQPYVLQGRRIDLPLNPVGRRQAACVSNLLQSVPLAAVYASPMCRALQTAEAIAAPHGLEVNRIDELIECDIGGWEGMDWETIRREFPTDFENFQRDSGTCPYLGGESYRDVSLRAIPAIETLLARYAGRTVVAVTHNVVNRVCAASLLGLDLAVAKLVRQNNGGVNIIRRHNGRTELVTLNSVFHLEDALRT